MAATFSVYSDRLLVGDVVGPGRPAHLDTMRTQIVEGGRVVRPGQVLVQEHPDPYAPLRVRGQVGLSGLVAQLVHGHIDVRWAEVIRL